MTSLQQKLATMTGDKVIVWVNHPELKTMNGMLVDVEPEHIAIMVDTHTYFVPYTAIAALRSAGN